MQAKLLQFLAPFYKIISNTMHVYINKKLVQFQNCFSLLLRPCQGKKDVL